MPRKKGEYKGCRMCQACRKLKPRNDLRFYHKTEKVFRGLICKDCYERWKRSKEGAVLC